MLERLVCAVRLSENCRAAPKLERAYDAELAALLQARAPTILYEPGMRALPVDYRRCRADPCAEGGEEGHQARAREGEPVTAFTHVVDCRRERAARSEAAGVDCSGPRRGNLYLHYWFYYPGSATAEGSTPLKPAIREVSAALGKPSHHRDDWESYQVRIGPGGSFARASSHHGHGYELGSDRLIPGFRLDTRGRGLALVRSPRVENGWGPETGTLYVSGGSHAGSARIYRRVARATKDHRVRLIPLRWIAAGDRTDFAVTPPWRKRVFFDPEHAGTD
ncbi:MAG: hypothetical protein ACRDKH_05100 [Solirubrobacterales bacterium]